MNFWRNKIRLKFLEGCPKKLLVKFQGGGAIEEIQEEIQEEFLDEGGFLSRRSLNETPVRIPELENELLEKYQKKLLEVPRRNDVLR